MLYEFQRVAIVNRGEAAMRFIHAAREFNRENSCSITTIALYTDPDRYAMFVREADEAFALGPAHVVDPVNNQRKVAYVDYDRLRTALTESRADAVWVGWGFVAEHAAFANLCRDLGIVFIGPDGEAMRRLGDKITSKLLAEKAGLDVVAWSGGPVDTLEDALCHAGNLGFPLMIKATAGGGGHGIRRVEDETQLTQAFESARAEAFRAFGNPTVFMERLMPAARHVEVQVIADHHGNTWAVGVRDCTIQRRHQKILEEAPSPALTTQEDRELRAAAVRLSQAAGYRNAGTVEFLYETATRRLLFMEMNTRLQVEHPVTECTTGIDLVKLQIHIARGGRLEGPPPRTTGHAIEVRLNAEDPDNGFAPAPGLIERFRMLTGPGVRIDTGVAEGDVIPAAFDSMMAKIIAYGRDRNEALSRLQRAAGNSLVVMRGGTSNKAFLVELLNRPEVQRGEFDTAWLDGLAATGDHLSRRHADIALLHAAIETYAARFTVEKNEFYSSALRGRPQVSPEVGRSVHIRYRGNAYELKIYRLGPREYRIDADGSPIHVQVETLGQYECWLSAYGNRFHVVSTSEGSSFRIEVDGVLHRIDRDDNGLVRAPAPAVIASMTVKPGDVVQAGDPIAVLEAMKMEMPVLAPFAGRVRQVMVTPHAQVDTGAPLVLVEPASQGEPAEAVGRVKFRDSIDGKAVASSWAEDLELLRRLVLGFDVDPADTNRLFSMWKEQDDQAAVRNLEDSILNTFVDIASLFARRPSTDGVAGAERPTAEAFLFFYLRMLDKGGEGLARPFVASLQRVLAHYGIQSLERSPELEEAMLWMYRSHHQVERQILPILRLLERRLELVKAGRQEAGPDFRQLLDRIVLASRGLSPAIADLAKEIRYRCFDQPQFEAARKSVYARAENHLAGLTTGVDSTEYETRVRELIDCPQPLVGLFSSRFREAPSVLRKVMLEVLMARYYRIRELTNPRTLEIGQQSLASAEYDFEGKHIHVFATHAEFSGLTDSLRTTYPLLESLPGADDIVIDLFVSRSGHLPDPEVSAGEIASILNQAGIPRSARRIVVALAGEGCPMQHFTYRFSGDAYREDQFYRGLHPMMAKRLHLWRLKNFRTERLPSVEDIYLLHAVAHDNPKDERLFACAEVRDLTPVRDEAGRVVQLPHLERMFSEALAGMRLFQSRRRPNERLYWNRILLYVWPSLELKPDEVDGIIRRLAPEADGLGLEQVVVRARIRSPKTQDLQETVVRISSPIGTGLLVTYRPAGKLQPLKPLTEYDQKVVRMRQRGLVYPYEIVKMMAPAPDDAQADFPPGEFVEYDLDADGVFGPVDRPFGQNTANVIAGVIENYTAKHPEGMKRILLLGDPSRDLGALAEPECRRIIAAIDLAEEQNIPVEWFPISAGAKISMESGVENMDWIAGVLRRLVEFTQAGGEVNLIVNGINVGAQPYWNAEATMLMHTRGILVMTPKGAMVLTGKRALDYSGSVSAEDNHGIGGYDRIMGPNGQAQYWARDIDQACQILFRHYEHTYVAPGERFPRRAETSDPVSRDVQLHPHGMSGASSFAFVGEIFSEETNRGHKRAFDIRSVMMSVIDQDHAPLERWAGMRAAETSVAWDVHLGGYPVCLIGIESRPLDRFGFVPADGPEQWCAGTLFPLSSKKVARAINAASNNRPVVILANLSGFDGSPESMRRLQLEFGAEIGRAVVNFKGPIVFCVISRYHGGAYVVFSRALNESLEVAALEGTHASVIGGAPAAAVVFAGEVDARTRKDPRVAALRDRVSRVGNTGDHQLRAQYNELYEAVRSEKLGEVAEEFDRVHCVERALAVGALHHIIPAGNLRPYLIDAVERGVEREEALRPARMRQGAFGEQLSALAVSSNS